MNTQENTGGIARNISATLQSLQTENESLRTGYDAARQEIASLQAESDSFRNALDDMRCGYVEAQHEIASLTAQHEGGKSEALADLAYAHGMTTGWNLCIADKHDEFARIRSMRSSQAISTIEAPQPAAQAQDDAGGWLRDGALLYRLTDERRPTNFDEIRVTMANGSLDIDQTSAQAERLLVMLSAPQPAAQAQPTLTIKPLQWSDEREPNDDVSYHHVVAESPLGRITVEWKGWKKYDSRCVYVGGEYIDSGSTLEDAKKIAERHLRNVVEALTTAAPTQAGEYPELPPLQVRYDGLGHTTTMGYGVSQMRDYADATCAARGAAQAAPVDAATWQPIASAPKDGKAILLRSKNGRIADGLWSAANSSTGFWAWAYVHQEPAEWMPKPGSPAARAQEQQP